MLYPTSLENKIGFSTIREWLLNLCRCEQGRHFVRSMAFSTDAALITKLLLQTHEMLQIICTTQAFPKENYIDVTEALENARIEGAVLEQQAIFDVKTSLRTLAEIIRFFDSSAAEKALHLKELAQSVSINTDLVKMIEGIIDDSGHIRDNASKELQSIRAELYAEQAALRKKIDNVLRTVKAEGQAPDDAAPTIRNGRVVVPVLAEYKRKVKGLIHDESATGQTVFIEPIEIFETNNRIKELENEERREIFKLLKHITDAIRHQLPDLKRAYKFLGIVDFILAKAQLAQKIHASLQAVVKEPVIKWHKTFHPLLYVTHNEQHKSVVPLSIKMDYTQRVLVVSGPNAGGKSVMLKTVGLLQYMHQCGLLVPNGEQCTFGVFNHLFVDIGDEQSIENDLSTYSSHLANMKTVLQHADKKSLVLIDEFGTGTDPQYGGAIAEAILEELVQKNAFAVVNTHYSNLKFFAENTLGVVNGAMKFDYETLSPAYELEMGKPGNSFALEIASKIGLPAKVIEKAKSKLGDKRLNVDKLIKELHTEKEQLKRKNAELEKWQKNVEATAKQYNELKAYIEQSQKETLKNAKAEAKRIVQEAKIQSKSIVDELKKSAKYDPIKVEISKAYLNDLEKKVAPPEQKTISKSKTDTSPLKVGDKVQIEGNEGVYKILTIKAQEAELALGELKTTVKISRLHKAQGDKEKEDAHPALRKVKGIDLAEKMATFSPSIDVRGKKGEEAVTLVDAWLDNALLLGNYDLRILHGKGDGILRKLIREHLKRIPFVQDFRDEKVEYGGDGITLVRLK